MQVAYTNKERLNEAMLARSVREEVFKERFPSSSTMANGLRLELAASSKGKVSRC
jgi:hypothetical protein